jgi:DNA-binding transcriptional LysR family regulator
MELSQLKSFRAVAEAQSFTRAAARLQLTQSAVSQRIKALESELGQNLFHRGRGGVTLTAAGRGALELAQRILDEVDALRDEVSGGAEPRGRVRIAAASPSLLELFDGPFRSFGRAHPGVEIATRATTNTSQTLADLREGLADIGFVSLPVDSTALRVTPLFEDELVLVVDPDHPLAQGGEFSATALAGEQLALFAPDATVRRTCEELFQRLGVALPLAVEVSDIQLIKRAVVQGVGSSVLPAWSVRDEVEAGRIAQLRVRGHRLRRVVAAASPARGQTAASRGLLDYLVARRDELQAFARDAAA